MSSYQTPGLTSSMPAPGRPACTFWPMAAPTAVADPNLSDPEFRLWCAMQIRGRWAKDVPGALLFEGGSGELAGALPWSLRKVQRTLHDLRDPSRVNGTRGLLYEASVPGRRIQVMRLPYPADPRQRAEYRPRAQADQQAEQARTDEAASLAADHREQAHEAARVASASAPQPLYTSRAAADLAGKREQKAADQARRQADEARRTQAEHEHASRTEQARKAKRDAVPQSEAGRQLVAALTASLPEQGGAVDRSALRTSVYGSTDADGELTVWCASRFHASELARVLGEVAGKVAGKAVVWKAWAGLLLLLALPLLTGPAEHGRPEPPAVELCHQERLDQRGVDLGDEAQLPQHPRDQRRGLLVPALPSGDGGGADAQQVRELSLSKMQVAPELPDLRPEPGRLDFRDLFLPIHLSS